MGPKKHLGQHFLTAPSYAQKIVKAIPAGAGDNILEIGPGKGALSIFLKKRFARFHCVEIDIDVIDTLRMKLGEGEYTIHRNDILEFDFSLAGFPLHVVGNLPYSIGAQIIRKTLFYGSKIYSCTFMVQREVAERIVASPHSKDYGFLSVFCSFFGRTKLLFHVPPGAFFPRPSVDSSVIQIIVESPESKLPKDKWHYFFEFVSKGFRQRRKKAVNSLASDCKSKETISEVMEELGIDMNARPEDLDCDEWLEIFKKV